MTQFIATEHAAPVRATLHKERSADGTVFEDHDQGIVVLGLHVVHQPSRTEGVYFRVQNEWRFADPAHQGRKVDFRAGRSRAEENAQALGVDKTRHRDAQRKWVVPQQVAEEGGNGLGNAWSTRRFNPRCFRLRLSAQV